MIQQYTFDIIHIFQKLFFHIFYAIHMLLFPVIYISVLHFMNPFYFIFPENQSL